MSEHANVQRYPLAWPVGWKRTPPRQRRAAPFRRKTARLSVWDAIQRLSSECERLGASEEIISTNVLTRLDGLPRSDQSNPDDPGAALYVTLDQKPMCFACDKWDRVADNIAAIAQHIDALRRIDRYGVGKMERAFAGYLALPVSTEEWYVVLGLSPYATIEDVEEAFRKKLRDAHPDIGGSNEDMARLTAARNLAREVLRS